MPFGEVKLIPGVNVERTPTLNEAGYSQSQLIRFKDGLAQKYGGWQLYYQFPVSGIPRELHAWEDLNSQTHLAVGSTTKLGVITAGTFKDVTPQTLTTNPAPNFSTIMGQPTVTIVDSNILNVTTFDSIFLNTPIAVGGLILSGAYPIASVTGADSYTITAASNATSTVNNAGSVPVFTATSGSSQVNVLLTANGQIVGNIVVFGASTTDPTSGVTIVGAYDVATFVDANDFTIISAVAASAGNTFSMNGGKAQIIYYINIGPQQAGSGYGFGAYNTGLYGFGTTVGSQTGTPITATDWTIDNWGEIALACPSGGGVYFYDPTAGYTNAGLVSTAPVFNGGLFVSTTQQILMCWASTAIRNIGQQQDPMLIKWSNSGDYTNFVPTTADQAGSFRIPLGSAIRAGMAAQNQNLFWTDLDVWAANYQGVPFIFGFNKIAAGAGAISSHSVQQLRGNVYWMGASNFYSLTSNGIAVIPCPVWDFVFQNLNTAYQQNVRAMPNTPYNEAGWLFPSSASQTGECDCYVKMNITEPNGPWDFGPSNSLQRSAWMDQTILGNPIAASSTGFIYQHEMTNDAAGSPLLASFTTGYFIIAEGEDFAFVDQIIPDMIWETYTGQTSATIQLTFNVTNYPGDAPVSYGPYPVNSTTEYISVRFRGRQMSVTAQSTDTGSFWRLGRIRYRYSAIGRR